MSVSHSRVLTLRRRGILSPKCIRASDRYREQQRIGRKKFLGVGGCTDVGLYLDSDRLIFGTRSEFRVGGLTGQRRTGLTNEQTE